MSTVSTSLAIIGAAFTLVYAANAVVVYEKVSPAHPVRFVSIHFTKAVYVCVCGLGTALAEAV
jgi:hypothetical protein